MPPDLPKLSAHSQTRDSTVQLFDIKKTEKENLKFVFVILRDMLLQM